MSSQPVKFMIVDDSLIQVGKLQGMLETMGHTVVGVARTGADAVETYRQCRPDVVTMDVTMPDMDGIEATRRIIAENPSARILMITSLGQERMVMEALKAGARGYVLKPVKFEKLDEVIRKLRGQVL